MEVKQAGQSRLCGQAGYLVCEVLARQNDPTGKSVVATKLVQPSRKIFRFLVGQISAINSPHPFPQEGRIAIVTNAGWDAVDAAASARKVVAGRGSTRERSGRAGRTALLRTAKPCGPDTRCWCQAAGG